MEQLPLIVQEITNTPVELFGVKKEDWFDFEALRMSGKVNMFGARQYWGLEKVEFIAILEHYSEMATAWKQEFEAR